MARTQIDPSLIPGSQNTPNILINGGFDVWQRNTTFSSPANGAYTADRWKMSRDAGPVFTVSQETSVTDNHANAYKIVISSGGGAGVGLAATQIIENYKELRGKTITFSMRVRTTSAFAVLQIADGVGNSIGTAHTGDDTYQTLSVTRTISTSSTAVQVIFAWGNNNTPSTGTHYFTAAMLTIGSLVMPFVIPDPQQELARSQRYFYTTPAVSNSYLVNGQCRNTTGATYIFRFPVPMRTGPTLTVNNATNFSTWGANGTQIALTALANGGGGSNTDSYILDSTVASGLVAGNATLLHTTNANAQLFFSSEI